MFESLLKNRLRISFNDLVFIKYIILSIFLDIPYKSWMSQILYNIFDREKDGVIDGETDGEIYKETDPEKTFDGK